MIASEGEGTARRPDVLIAFLLSGTYGLLGAVAAALLIPAIARRTEVALPLPLPLFLVLLAIQLTVIYGLLGWAGLAMARRRGLDPARAPGRQGMAVASVAGVGAGFFLVLAVKIISSLFPGTLPSTLHPPDVFSALAASAAASFGEEILCRLFMLSLILRVLPVSAASGSVANAGAALFFAAMHTPALIALSGGLAGVPALAWVWIIVFNFLAGLVFGALFLRRGIGAAIAGHASCDLVWHVAAAGW